MPALPEIPPAKGGRRAAAPSPTSFESSGPGAESPAASKSRRPGVPDAIKGMSKAMESMGYYLVLVFFAALFIASFSQSGFGALLAVKGANFLKSTNAPPAVTIAGIILLTAMINLLIGSASAKWACGCCKASPR